MLDDAGGNGNGSFVMNRLDSKHGHNNGISRVDSLRRGGASAPRNGSRKGFKGIINRPGSLKDRSNQSHQQLPKATAQTINPSQKQSPTNDKKTLGGKTDNFIKMDANSGNCISKNNIKTTNADC